MTSPRMKRTVGTAGLFGVLLGAALVAAPSSGAAPPSPAATLAATTPTRSCWNVCDSTVGVEHMEEFQAIADASGGNRADQTPGSQASVD